MGDGPLVGREHQVAAVEQVLARPGGGSLLITGPPGTGRTRLLQEAAGHARRLHREVIGLRGTAGSTLPFGALLGHLDAVPPLDTEADRARAVAAAARHLEHQAAAGARQLVVTVDDAHTLDPLTTATLTLLLDREAAVVVATNPSGTSVPWLDRPRTSWTTTGDLGDDQATRLAEARCGAPLDGGTRRSLLRATGGNAALVVASLQGAADAGTLVEHGQVVRLVGGSWADEPVLEIVRRRLSTSTPEALQALHVAAVAGGVVEHALLTRCSDPAGVDALERTGHVQVERHDRRVTVRVHPPLVAVAVRRLLGASERATHSRALAEAIAATGARRHDDAARIARLRLDAGDEVPAPVALSASRLARSTADVHEAERLARVACLLTEDVEPRLELADLVHETGRPGEAEAILREAPGRDDRDRTLLALARANNLVWSLDDGEGARRALTDASAQVQDEQLRTELVAAMACVDHLGGESGAAVQAILSKIDRATGRARYQSLVDLVSAAAFTGRLDQLQGWVDEALVLDQQLADEPVRTDAGFLSLSLALALTEHGALDDADELSRAAYDVCTELDEGAGQGWFALLLGRIALLRGDLAAAERLFAESAWRFEGVGLPGPPRWSRAGSVLVAATRGERPDTPTMVSAAGVEAEQHSFRLHEPDCLRAMGWVAHLDGDHVGALASLGEAARLARKRGAFVLEVHAWHDLTRLAAHRDELGEGLERTAALATRLDSPLARAVARRAEATAGSDAEGLEAVARSFDELGMALAAAECWAEASAVHGRRGRRARAARARQAADGLVQPDWRTPALARRGTGADLTPRELQVARLAATGLRTDAIADELGIGFRTVENHLHRAYGKLGIEGKHQLGDALDHTGAS